MSTPTPEQIRSLIATSPDISEAVIQQADEQVDELAALARTWISNGDQRFGVMLNCLCIAFGYQKLVVQRLLNENANLRARLQEGNKTEVALHEALVRETTLAAQVAAVRALCDEVENRMMATAKPSEIRAALDGTEIELSDLDRPATAIINYLTGEGEPVSRPTEGDEQ